MIYCQIKCSVGWIDDNGSIPRVKDLKNCLLQKGWKKSINKPASFKAGYIQCFQKLVNML